MDNEIRIRLLKEYEKTKMSNVSGKISSMIFLIIVFSFSFIRLIVATAEMTDKQNIIYFHILATALFLAIVWQIVIMVKFIYYNKILMLLQALLGKDEEAIYNEISIRDVEKEDGIN